MVSTSAGEIAALSWSEAGSEAPLLHFAHATGFNAHTYRRLLEPLSKRFRIAASDARGMVARVYWRFLEIWSVGKHTKLISNVCSKF